MSDDTTMLKLSRKGRLSAEATYLMLKGAGWAALVVFGIWIGVALIAALGRGLPEASRDTPDPAPQAFIDFAEREAAAPVEDEPVADEPVAEDEPAPVVEDTAEEPVEAEAVDDTAEEAPVAEDAPAADEAEEPAPAE